MKVLITGSDKIFAIENFYVKYLREEGVEVIFFPSHSIFSNHYQANTFNKVLYKIGLSDIYNQINKELKRVIELHHPDIVWVFKGMEILPETLVWIKNREIRLVNYNPDNPFLFSGSGSGNSNITNSVTLYDLHFTYNLEIKVELETKFKARTYWLPFGFDITELLFGKLEAQTETLEACFLGNPDTTRSTFIKSLAASKVPITLYGLHWNKFINHSLVKIKEPVYGDELWKVLRKYRVQLNLMRPHNLNSHNMRTFEVPGAGGIMIAPDTTEHRCFFEQDKEFFLFNEITECAHKIKSILEMPMSKANEIRVNARNKSLNAGYTYKDRTKQALAELNNLVL